MKTRGQDVVVSKDALLDRIARLVRDLQRSSTTLGAAPCFANAGLWRLYTFEQKDGGVYVQCEFISLTRDIPFGLGWLIRPLVTSSPKQSLTRALIRTRAEIIRERGPAMR